MGFSNMVDSGGSQKEVSRPYFSRAIMIDFQGATRPQKPILAAVAEVAA
jgi:hypothetical protein